MNFKERYMEEFSSIATTSGSTSSSGKSPSVSSSGPSTTSQILTNKVNKLIDPVKDQTKNIKAPIEPSLNGPEKNTDYMNFNLPSAIKSDSKQPSINDVKSNGDFASRHG